jgi:hypothetical protein
MTEISIICTRQNGIYRAGVYHPGGKKVWPPGSFTVDQLALIRKEPFLEVLGGNSSADQSDTSESALESAFIILSPFFRVPEGEVRELLKKIVYSDTVELSPVADPILERPLEADASEPEEQPRAAKGRKGE